AEFSTSTRAGMHRYHYPSGEERCLLLDLRHRDKTLGAMIRVESPTRISGYRRSEAWAKDQYIFFAMELSQPLKNALSNREGKIMQSGSEMEGTDLALILRLENTENGLTEPLLVKIGISTVDAEGARRNLETEMPGWDFEKIRSSARAAWNRELSKILFYAKEEKAMRNFYTSLYHTMVVPNVLSDVDGRYRGRDNLIHTAEGYTQYTVFSLWDTFRATHPLYAFIDRRRTFDYIQTFLAQYRQGGRLPVWELSSNETDCMIGYHSVSVITDALVKGIGGFDTTLAFEAMKKSATWPHLGLPAYIQNGYIAVEDEHESVSKTLEYAYDDWCIAEVAGMLGDTAERSAWLRRAASYRNVYDPQSGFMRPRRNGDFLPGFDPREVNNHYTEANSWQYSFFVPQDIPGMVRLMGGPEQAEARLDGLFSAPVHTTGRTQADITGLIGQYAHGNEPSHHMAYLYDYIGKPWKTQRLLRTIMDSLYRTGPEGLPGNEDCGQMSAWFVWSALGLYPVTPGSPYYAIGSPLFDSAVVNLENGHRIRLYAKNNNLSAPYIRQMTINGKEVSGNLITHPELLRADSIVFTMAERPALDRGTAPERRGALEVRGFYRAPLIKTGGRLFKDSLLVSIESPDGAPLVYGQSPGLMMTGEPYRGPFYIHSGCTLYAQAMDQQGKSGVTAAGFYKLPNQWDVKLHTAPSTQYAAEGPVSMIDGVYGTENWRKGDWHGYQSRDMDVEISLGKEEKISSVEAGFLQDTRSWILMPKEVVVEISTDGKKWKEVARKANTIADNNLQVQTQRIKIEFTPLRAKYVRVKAGNYGVLPTWHQGAGYDAFIFCDEISIR
ncbi:MAG: GH92 family glycosyl hydrolase, partial [Bacteroidia bacterium]|nr:GH92 family glycosyl hydrolase [Bacteroidia bacterium]